MSINLINIGNVVNDGTGDDLRTAFQKVNANFQTLDSSLTVTASNVGVTGSDVFKQKTGANLEFRKLVSGTKMLLDQTTDSIIVNNTSPDAFTRIDTNSGSVLASSFDQITVQGGADIDVTSLGSVITINNVLPVTNILTTFDFGFIKPNFSNAIQLSLASSNIDFGTLTLPGIISLDCGGLT